MNILSNFRLDLFATTKGGGSTRNGRDSNPKYLGMKKSDGQAVKPGHIIFRQRGTVHLSGKNTMMGRDHTIFSVATGVVSYRRVNRKSVINVITEEEYKALKKFNK